MIILKTNLNNTRLSIIKYPFIALIVEFFALFFLQSGYLFPDGRFLFRVYQTVPFVYARLCAKPLALTRSFHVFTLGIFPCFLKNFLIFDEQKIINFFNRLNSGVPAEFSPKISVLQLPFRASKIFL
jgi:hypothetical protein